MIESRPFPRAAQGSPTTTGTRTFDAAAISSAANQTPSVQLVKGALPMSRLITLSQTNPVLSALRLILDELADLASQLVEVGQGTITLHCDRATLANVAAQIQDAVFGDRS